MKCGVCTSDETAAVEQRVPEEELRGPGRGLGPAGGLSERERESRDAPSSNDPVRYDAEQSLLWKQHGQAALLRGGSLATRSKNTRGTGAKAGCEQRQQQHQQQQRRRRRSRSFRIVIFILAVVAQSWCLKGCFKQEGSGLEASRRLAVKYNYSAPSSSWL